MNATTNIQYCTICKTNVTECRDSLRHAGFKISVEISLEEYHNNIKNNVWPNLIRLMKEKLISEDDIREIENLSRTYAKNLADAKYGIQTEVISKENFPITFKNTQLTLTFFIFSLAVTCFLISLKIFATRSVIGYSLIPLGLSLYIYFKQRCYNNSMYEIMLELNEMSRRGIDLYTNLNKIISNKFYAKGIEQGPERMIIIEWLMDKSQFESSKKSMISAKYSEKRYELIQEKIKSIQL